MEHSFFMTTPDERMESFFKIAHARDTKRIPRRIEFRSLLTDEPFKQCYLGWDTNMGPNLRSVYEYKDENGRKRNYNGQSVMDLLDLLRNAYRHPGKSTINRLDEEVRIGYPGFLNRLHEALCRYI